MIPRSSRSWWEICNSCSPFIFSRSNLWTYCCRQSSRPNKAQERKREYEGDVIILRVFFPFPTTLKKYKRHKQNCRQYVVPNHERNERNLKWDWRLEVVPQRRSNGACRFCGSWCHLSQGTAHLLFVDRDVVRMSLWCQHTQSYQEKCIQRLSPHSYPKPWRATTTRNNQTKQVQGKERTCPEP